MPLGDDIQQFIGARPELTPAQRMVATAIAELTHISLDKFLDKVGADCDGAERDAAVAAGLAAVVYAWQRSAARHSTRVR